MSDSHKIERALVSPDSHGTCSCCLKSRSMCRPIGRAPIQCRIVINRSRQCQKNTFRSIISWELRERAFAVREQELQVHHIVFENIFSKLSEHCSNSTSESAHALSGNRSCRCIKLSLTTRSEHCFKQQLRERAFATREHEL